MRNSVDYIPIVVGKQGATTFSSKDLRAYNEYCSTHEVRAYGYISPARIVLTICEGSIETFAELSDVYRHAKDAYYVFHSVKPRGVVRNCGNTILLYNATA